MSITITGGISFSGGVGIVAPPPADNTAGWFGGGSSAPRTVQRIIFATDTATATVRGGLAEDKYSAAATGNFNDGWFGGGMPGYSSSVNRITYATDTATASIRGALTSGRSQLAATGTTTYGWFAGGLNGSALDTIDRITFATDTATASARGPLSGAKRALAATSDGTTYGWFISGTALISGTVGTTTVQRITYATDTATATVRGPLSNSGGGSYFEAATGNTDYGWVLGGYDLSNNITSRVQRITYATDTATASTRGSLLVDVICSAAVTSSTYGWNGGGLAGGAPSTTVNRITYATDTATASDRGPLAAANRYLAASSGVQ